MITYTTHFKDFNVSFEPIMKKFFITSKDSEDNRPQIGGFNLAAEAITFAQNRVK